MPRKMDSDGLTSVKLLQMFRKFLVDGKKHYQADLAREFNCSAQSVIRMTDTIERVMGVNFESGIEHRRKWYRIASKHTNTLGLDFEELRYMSICREMAGNILPTGVVSRIADTIFNMSVLMLNPSYAERIRQGRKDFTLFSKGRIDYSPHTAAIDSIMAAIEQHWVCKLKYQSVSRKEGKEHLFAPAKMVSMNQALYVLGATLDEDTRKVRRYTTLAVHRIKGISLTNRHFDVRFPEVDTDIFGLPWHEPRTYRIRFSASAATYVRERIWSDGQEIEDLPDGGIILTLVSQSEKELQSWVRSFGEDDAMILDFPDDNNAKQSRKNGKKTCLAGRKSS